MSVGQPLQDTSTGFVTGLRSRSQEAWERFFHIYVPLIQSICRDYIPDENDVDDIVSEVIQKVLVYIQKFVRKKEGRLKHYVQKTTWSQIQEHYRCKSKRATIPAPVTKSVFDQKYTHRFLRRVINDVRQRRRFSNQSWKAFELYITEVRCYQEIGRRLHQKPDTVSKSIRRILAAINDELSHH